MSKKYLIALDDGHGMNTAGKRTPALIEDLFIDGKLIRKKGESIRENEFNRAVVNYLSMALKRCGFDVLLVASGDSDVPLKTRVQRANAAKADAYISKHYNAVEGLEWQTKAKGPVTIINYNSSSTSKILAENVHEELWKLHSDHKCINYGVKKDVDISGFSLYVLRNTNMPAILTESGFMDNMIEAVKMLDEKFQKSDAEATCKGICKTFGVNYIEPVINSTDKEQSSNDVNKPATSNEVFSDKYIKILANELNIRADASWDDNSISGTVRKGEIYTVIEKLKVDTSYMYKLKSGYFITASEKYVQIYNK